MKPNEECLVVLCTLGALASGCATSKDSVSTPQPEPRVERVLTQEEQSRLTPDE